MASLTGERSFSKAWIVLAVILVLFVVTIVLDGLIQTLVPSYVGLFNFISPAGQPAGPELTQ